MRPACINAALCRFRRKLSLPHVDHNAYASGSVQVSFELGDRVLALAAKAGGDASVLVRELRTGHVRFAAGEITTSGEATGTETQLTVGFGQRHAKSTTNQTDDASLAALVSRTVALAKIAPEDPEHLPPLGPQKYVQNARAWDEATHVLAPAARASAARTALARAEEAALVASGFVQSHATETTLSASTGLRAEHRATWAQMTMTARTRDGTGSGWAGGEETSAADLDADALAHAAVDRARRSQSPTKLDPGRYTVILEPAAVADLLSFLTDALDARAADQGRSFFSRAGGNRIGETIFDPRVTLRSDPLDPATPGSPFDGDGVPLAATTWIDRGTLASLNYTRFWARESRRNPTGAHATWHLTSSAPTAPTPAALMEGVKRGLLVTRFWYTRWLDPKQILVTGLTRDGVFLIEDGRVTRAVNNFRFNDSPVKMLSRLVGMTSRTYRTASSGDVVRVPLLCCDDFEMASVSDAV